ncbi:MAG: pyridoxamine 5'-phosphate oxidase family protein [Pseudomonadota bacterium]
MAKTYERLDERLCDFIRAQKMFFVASAPLSEDGHVNLSPKGYDSLRILDEKTVAWIDLGGSGIETQAHVQENGRMTIMFCAFEGPANILRLFGSAEVIDFDHPDFPALKHSLFSEFERARAIFKLRLSRIQDSCGWGVPFYSFTGDRDQLARATAAKGEAEWREKRYRSNARSIDGLVGLSETE